MDEVCNETTVRESQPSELEGDESSTSSSSTSKLTPWRPLLLSFRPYYPALGVKLKPQPFRVFVRKPLVVRLTKDIVEIYQTCNSQFRYAEELNPNRFLTSPSEGLFNDGFDNANSDLILTINFVLINLDSGRRRLGLGEPKPIGMSLQLADRSVKYQRGIIEDVFVKMDKFIFPADIVVLDMEEDMDMPLILGRPFLTTGKALIDVQKEKLILRVDKERIEDPLKATLTSELKEDELDEEQMEKVAYLNANPP